MPFLPTDATLQIDVSVTDNDATADDSAAADGTTNVVVGVRGELVER